MKIALKYCLAFIMGVSTSAEDLTKALADSSGCYALFDDFQRPSILSPFVEIISVVENV